MRAWIKALFPFVCADELQQIPYFQLINNSDRLFILWLLTGDHTLYLHLPIPYLGTTIQNQQKPYLIASKQHLAMWALVIIIHFRRKWNIQIVFIILCCLANITFIYHYRIFEFITIYYPPFIKWILDKSALCHYKSLRKELKERSKKSLSAQRVS